MPSTTPVSASDGLVNAAAEKSVEIELQARREALAQGISCSLAWFCLVVSIALVAVWLLARPYTQILIYALLILLLALGAGVYSAFQRRNRKNVGVFLVYGMCLVIVLFGPLLIPSLMPAIGIMDISAMTVAIMLLGDRASRGLVGALALAYLADVFAVAILGWSPFPPLERNAELWVTGIVSLAVILTAIMIIRLIVLGLEQQFRRAQRLNLQLERQIQAANATQETLQQERNLLRTLIDAVPENISIFIKDAQSRYVDADAGTIRRFGGYTARKQFGKTDFDFFPPEIAAKYFADEQAMFQSGQPMLNREELIVDYLTHEPRWILTTKAPIRNERGEFTGLVGVSLDVTDYRRAQEALKQQQAFLRQVIDSIPDLLFVKDWDGNTILVNKAFAELYGTTVEALIEQGKGQLVSPQDEAEHFTRDDHEVMTTLKPKYIPEETLTDLATGRTRYLRTIKVPLIALDGQARSVLGVSIDITERKQAEAQALALAAEQQRVRLLREFITDVSHDFRTPLSIIGTSAFVVGKTTDPAKLTQCSQRIEEQISRLRLLLDNFVELSHLEQQASSLPFQAADLDGLVTAVVDGSKSEIAAKNQRLEYHCVTPSALVLGDPTALTQAITHVVANAIHFTPSEGVITLRLYSEGESAVVEVADTGIGIPAEHLPHIFESFYRVDSARSTKSGGAGLGLSIARRIVELMKGRIEVESEFGAGSIFRIYLPIVQ